MCSLASTNRPVNVANVPCRDLATYRARGSRDVSASATNRSCSPTPNGFPCSTNPTILNSEACNAISDQVDPEGNIIFGAAFDPSLDGVIRVSVVATGMDGASMAAIEPARPRMPSRAAPLIAPQTAQAEAAEMEPVRAEAWTMEAEPEPVETSLFDIEPVEEEQPALVFEEPVFEAAPAPVARIVDPMVDEDEEPLMADSHYEEAPRKSGWLSLFGGRQRYEAPAAPTAPAPQRAAAGGRSAAAPQMIEEAAPDENDDLEIPSFLRRLAN